MKHFTFRLKTAAPLSAVLMTAVLAVTPNVWASGSDVPGAKLIATNGTEVTNGSAVLSDSLLPLRAEAPAGIAVDDVKYVLDGAYLGVVDVAPYKAPITNLSVGDHKLRSTFESGKTNYEFTVRFTVSSASVATTSSTTSSTVPVTTLPTTSTTLVPVTVPPVTVPPVSTGANVTVTDARSLKNALAAVQAGETITLADGTYLGNTVKDGNGSEPGRFAATVSGTASAPITLRGSRNAIIDGGGPGGGYGLHLESANYWNLEGFTVSGASKGIVLDSSSHVVIDGVQVTNIGMEGVHFRTFSSDNVIENSEVHNTGVSSPNFGEGVYIGSANSNWGTYTGGKPDNSDRNQVLNNHIYDDGAENIDIKEGSTGGVIKGNLLGGDKTSGQNSADGWIDVKGNGYLIDSNHGVHTSITLDPAQFKNCNAPRAPNYPNQKDAPFCNGFEVHTAVPGWGQNNTFSNNVLDVNANTGNQVVGIWFQNTAVGVGNVIKCNNVVNGATVGDYAYNHFMSMTCTA